MKKRYIIWSTLLSALTISSLTAKHSLADSGEAAVGYGSNLTGLYIPKSPLFLEPSTRSSGIILAGHRSHSSHRSHASHSSGSYTRSVPQPYEPSPDISRPRSESYTTPNTGLKNPSSISVNDSAAPSASPNSSTSKIKYQITLKNGSSMTVQSMQKNGDKIELLIAEGMTLMCAREDIMQVKDYQSGKLLFPAKNEIAGSTYVARLSNGSTLVADKCCTDKNNIVLTIQDKNIIRLAPSNVLEVKEVNTGIVVYPPVASVDKCQ